MRKYNAHLTAVKDGFGNVDYKGNKPVTMVPAILRTYYDETVKPPVRMYECEGGRHFIADTYDRNFKVKPGKIKGKDYRDITPNFRHRLK